MFFLMAFGVIFQCSECLLTAIGISRDMGSLSDFDQSGGEDPPGHAVHAVKRDNGQHRGMEYMARLFDRFDIDGRVLQGSIFHE
jgi:hypothetical protein